MKQTVKPCELPCPKCGSTDIYRQYRKQGDVDVSYDDTPTKRSNDYIHIDGWLIRAKQECISHHCRTCHYDWETGIMKAD